MSKSFTEHLFSVSGLPVKLPEFLEGYAACMQGVAQSVRSELYGLTIDAPPGVYTPHETSSTRFFMDHFDALGVDLRGGALLEIGCGAGALSILAAKRGWTVCAGDIDPVAVDATLSNASLNEVSVDARESDLFSAFTGQKFDVVLFNQPFFHLDRQAREDERTLSDFGGLLHVKFMAEARKHLKEGGHVIFAFSNCSNAEVLNQPGWVLELRSFDFDAVANYIRAHFKAVPV